MNHLPVPAAYPPYQHYYNSPLLDELHNYFPAILYEPTRFPNVTSLLAYVHVKMRERFDLFSTAQHMYQQTTEYTRHPQLPPMGPQPVVRTPPGAAQTEDVTIRMETVPGGGMDLMQALLGLAGPATGRTLFRAPQTEDTVQQIMNLLAAAPLIPIGGGGGGGGRRGVAAGGGGAAGLAAMEPVIVRPTAAEIDAGTTLEVVDTEEDGCAICQDIILVGDEVRGINACDHRFHRNCIDTWFQRNVRCPVCRHDVREPAAADDETDGEDSP